MVLYLGQVHPLPRVVDLLGSNTNLVRDFCYGDPKILSVCNVVERRSGEAHYHRGSFVVTAKSARKRARSLAGRGRRTPPLFWRVIGERK